MNSEVHKYHPFIKNNKYVKVRRTALIKVNYTFIWMKFLCKLQIDGKKADYEILFKEKLKNYLINTCTQDGFMFSYYGLCRLVCVLYFFNKSFFFSLTIHILFEVI